MEKTDKKLFHLTREEALFNVRVKYYPGVSAPCQIIIADDPVFNPHHLEPDKRSDTSSCEHVVSDDDGESDGFRRSFIRARRRAYDLIRCNPDLDGFVTLTFNKEMIDRTSYAEIISTLSVWLDNRVRRHGLKYVLCPEHHADGEGIHFHGLMNMCALKLVNSGHKRHGKVVYNIDDFPLGFTTAIRVTGENCVEKCAAYIFKYMTKQLEQKIGGRYFLSGGLLEKPRYEYFSVDTEKYSALERMHLPGMSCEIVCLSDPEKIQNLTISGLLKEIVH